MSLLYLLSFLDRTNIGNANLFGLSKDLGLTSTQYAACLACFFVFYVLFEGESTVLHLFVLCAWERDRSLALSLARSPASLC